MIPLVQAAESAGVGFFEVFAIALVGLYAIVKSYGLAIILLTLAVRVLLLPLSIKQTRSMREMQVIQPEVKKLQAKHKGDRQKMNEEMMKLYKEHGVNPFGGCLPLFMQFPVLIALFYVIRTPLAYMGYAGREVGDRINWTPFERVPSLLEQAQASDLASQLDTAPLAINRFIGLRLDCAPSGVLSGDTSATVDVACGSGLISFFPYLVMILLMGFTTYYQQKQMQARQDGQNPQMQQMQTFMKIMPLMLMVFSFNFPTGVVMYWLTTNVWTIVQQRIILKAAPPIVPKKEEEKQEKKAREAEKKSEPSGKAAEAAGTSGASGGNGKAGTRSSRSAHSRKRKKKKR